MTRSSLLKFTILAFFGLQISSTYSQTVNLTLVRGFGDTAEKLELPVELESLAFRQSILQRYRPLDGNLFTAVKRADATQESIQSSRELARKALAELEAESIAVRIMSEKLYFDGVGSEAEYESRLHRQMEAHRWAMRILSVTGDSDDVEMLTSNISDRLDVQSLKGRIEVAASIESRLGTIANGRITQLLQHEDEQAQKFAAVQLHRYGVSAGTEHLLAILRNPNLGPAPKDDAASELIYGGSPKVLPGMRDLIAQRLDQKFGFTPRCLNLANWYLLAVGNEDDLANLGPLVFGPEQADLLVFIVKDRAKVMEFFYGLGEGQIARYDLRLTRRLYEFLDALPEGEAADFEESITQAISDAAIKSGAWKGLNEKSQRKATEYTMAITRSFNRPNLFTADRALEGQYFYNHSDVTWMPRLAKHCPNLLQEYVKGNREINSLLFDYIGHDELAKYLQDSQADTHVLRPDLLLAYHAIATRGFQVPNRFPNQKMRRAFALANTEFSGMVSGTISVSQKLRSGKLVIGIQLDLAAGGRGTMISAANKKTQGIPPYGIEGMIGNVVLQKNGQKIPMHAIRSDPSVDGMFWFAAPWPEESFEQTNLHFDFHYLEVDYPMDFALFASDAARMQRQDSSN